jgi:hypothetical protein
LQINEVLPLAPGGTVQAYALSGFDTTTTPYSATLSPQYSATQPLGTWIPVPRATGSYLVFSGVIGTNAIVGDPSGQVLFCFYTSNSPTATPFAVRAVSVAASGSSAYNATFIPFAVVATTGVTDIPFPVYVTVCSLTTGNLVQSAEILSDFQEVFIGSLTSSVNSVTASSGSYLTASTVSNAVTIGTTRATTTQAGLVSVATSVPVNGLIRTNSIGTLVATQAPLIPYFGANLFIDFGGAHVGQVQGAQQTGIGVYQSGGAAIVLPNSSIVYLVDTSIGVNIATLGTSTGLATLVGLPINYTTGIFATPVYTMGQIISGITIPNGTLFFGSVTGGSNVITLWYYTINNNSYTQLTKANFAATNIQFRIPIKDFYTPTAPTN